MDMGGGALGRVDRSHHRHHGPEGYFGGLLGLHRVVSAYLIPAAFLGTAHGQTKQHRVGLESAGYTAPRSIGAVHALLRRSRDY